jgi:hypothetical protein
MNTDDKNEIKSRKSGISPTTQAASEQAAAKNPRSSGPASPQSHRDFDETDLRKPSPTTGKFANVPDNQEGIGP